MGCGLSMYISCRGYTLLCPQLQKSAVLQKTIDYIRYLEKNVKVLHEENQQLRQTLGKGVYVRVCVCVRVCMCVCDRWYCVTIFTCTFD